MMQIMLDCYRKLATTAAAALQKLSLIIEHVLHPLDLDPSLFELWSVGSQGSCTCISSAVVQIGTV
jgi:hypothetical protein